MTDRQPNFLPELSPPAGGLARLRARRDELQRPVLERWLRQFNRAGVKAYAPLLAGACTALMLVLWWPQRLPSTLATDRLLGAKSAGERVRVLDAMMATQQLPSSQSGVRLYWTESLQHEVAETRSP
ncbi:hypothetical protein HPT27_12240 [Permianibacter sp. IMCC34836]|uniref:hypothetical protein n=1 Tax=Permianibacter fluminis TaxID=2738515 RepID=UPI001556DF85|nr:hypothetical protein [Permianibacter fluminis]NQD37797.1 hypothetical protein [Permianibacter fluminis]